GLAARSGPTPSTLLVVRESRRLLGRSLTVASGPGLVSHGNADPCAVAWATRARLSSMSELISAPAQEFAAAHTTPFDGPLAEASEWTRANTPWPGMMAGVPEARLLEALIVVSGARSVLELGTFTGVGALAMAAALPADGRLVTLERDPENAAMARRHIAASPLADRIELIEGDARE